MELDINGKKVVLKAKLPAKANWDLIQNFDRFAEGTLEFDKVADLLARIIDTWELEGDPHDPVSYEALDLFSEMMPLMGALGEFVTQKAVAPKN